MLSDISSPGGSVCFMRLRTLIFLSDPCSRISSEELDRPAAETKKTVMVACYIPAYALDEKKKIAPQSLEDPPKSIALE